MVREHGSGDRERTQTQILIIPRYNPTAALLPTDALAKSPVPLDNASRVLHY